MNETLTVHDFGPIRDATVTFKRVTVFIGPTGGGKSTLAKLAAMFRDGDYVLEDPEYPVKELAADQLAHYQLTNYGRASAEVKWKSEWHQIRWNERSFSRSISPAPRTKLIESITKKAEKFGVKLKAAETPLNAAFMERLLSKMPPRQAYYLERSLSQIVADTVYVPAERVFAGLVTKSPYGLRKANIGLPETLIDFLSDVEEARSNLPILHVPFFDVSYTFRDDEHVIGLSDGRYIPLTEAASGIQSVVPLLLVITHLEDDGIGHSFIIEEPELNLFPEAQQQLLNVLVAKCARAEGPNDLIITTHSPYVLAACNLLLEAWKVWEKRPDLAAEIAAIVPRESWINPAEFAAYHVADGGVKNITDERTHLVGGNELDAVSGTIADAFRHLLRLAKQQPAA